MGYFRFNSFDIIMIHFEKSGGQDRPKQCEVSVDFELRRLLIAIDAGKTKDVNLRELLLMFPLFYGYFLYSLNIFDEVKK